MLVNQSKVTGRYIGLFWLIILGIILSFPGSQCLAWNGHSNGFIKARKGVLDLSNGRFNEDKIYSLDGQWGFYWHQLLTPRDFQKSIPPVSGYFNIPGKWNGHLVKGMKLTGDGYATFRLLIRVDKEPHDRIYGLKILPMGTAYKLWINGDLSARNGKVGVDARKMVPQYAVRQVSFIANNGIIKLILQISNFVHRNGGPLYHLQFGTMPQLQKDLLEISFELLLIGGLFIISIYFFGIYFLRRKDLAPCYLGLFSLFVCIRALTYNEYFLTRMFPGLSWEILIRMEYLSLFLLVPTLVLFLNQLFPKEFSKKIVHGFCLTAIVFGISVFTPVKMFTHTLPAYLVVIMGCMFYSLLMLLKAWRHWREGAAIIGIGYSFLMLAGTNDVLNYNYFLDTGFYTPLGVLIFAFSYVIVLGLRYSRFFAIVETRWEDLLHHLADADEEEKDVLMEKTAPTVWRQPDNLKDLQERTKMTDFLSQQLQPDQSTAEIAATSSRESVESPRKISVLCFGQFEVYSEKTNQPFKWRTVRIKEIFAYFLCHRKEALSLERLVNEFWPDLDPDKATRQLHTAIYHIRKTLKQYEVPDGIRFCNGNYQINSSCVDCDSLRFEELVNAGIRDNSSVSLNSLEIAVNLYRGDYLEGIDFPWAINERERLAVMYALAVKQLARAKLDSGEYEKTVGLLLTLLQRNPLLEEVHLLLMQAYYRMGDRGKVDSQYKTLTKILREELGVKPSPETKRFYEEWSGK